MSSSINAALAAAKEAAANASTQAPVVIDQPSSNAVAPLGAPARRLTTDDRIGGAFAVDHYLKFTPGGVIQVGSDVTHVVPTLRVAINLAEIGAGVGISYEGPGGALVYARTTDMVTAEDGSSWADAVATAKKFKPNLQPYNAWQLPFVLLGDKEVGPAKPGDRLGYTTVWSSFKEFAVVFDKAKALFGPYATVELELSCKIAKNKQNKVFGQALFRLIGELGGDE